MNIRQVKGFCKLVETMNFSRAAEQMYMSQPAFSRMIESLETELETRLIERGKPGPRLTEAGETLLPNMRRILDEYNEITEKVHSMSMKKGALTVGILEEGLQGKRAELLRGFSQENPDIDINFVEVSESSAFDAVLERKVDCALVTHFPESLRDRLEADIMGRVPKCAVINGSNPLSGRDVISVADLKDESFVVIDENKSRYGYYDTIGLCMKSGFKPRIVKKASSLSTALSEVEMNAGVMILSQDLKLAQAANVAFIPLKDEDLCNLWCVHVGESDSQNMKKFSEFIREKVPQE